MAVKNITKLENMSIAKIASNVTSFILKNAKYEVTRMEEASKLNLYPHSF